MKTKILALIACVFVSGTVGAILNNNASAAAVNGKTVTSTSQSVCNQTNGTAAKTCSTVPTYTQTSNAANKGNCGTSGTCPQTAGKTAGATTCKTASNCAGNTVCNSGNYVNSANCKSGNSTACTSGNCANSSNCKGGNCASNNCTNGTNCVNGNCVCVIGNNKFVVSGSFPNFKICLQQNSGSCPNSASSKPSTGTKSPASSQPASSNPSSGSAATGSYASFQNQVVQLVNQERAKAGLKALTVNSQLTKTATLKSEDMAKLNYFDHTSPTYGSPFDMMKQFGISYRAAGENIAMGQTSSQQVMQGWMNSPGHRANILNASFTQIGVGIAKNANGQYIWTQQFIG
ncbi:CAP domain-containing protein [Caproiciproducens galactitolivorans]|uniref:CAP domain-containing protein n=1 Tax=Caproiciproducens galactitolivorans TaxID=642589 RepID=A0ABT4BQV3_9FIRM|nr:CAP domain-containing protein [Caproiciproducens galactitolivorans]MCY1712720.1 CAP domain-containing protein [Caproiciproducens galactitolivorans]